MLACYLVWIAATALYITFFGGTAFAAFLTWIAAWQESTENWTRLVLDGIGLAAFYLLFLLGLGVLKRVFIDRWLWIAVALTTTIVNLSAADRVARRVKPLVARGRASRMPSIWSRPS